MSALTLNREMTEDQLLTAITEALTLYGWRWVHFRRSDKAQMMGHAGFPDICAARDGMTRYLELKSHQGQVSDDQHAWLKAIDPFYGSRGSGVWVIRPRDLDWLLETLR